MLSGLLGRALLVGADGDFTAILGPSGEIDSLLVVASSAFTSVRRAVVSLSLLPLNEQRHLGRFVRVETGDHQANQTASAFGRC